MMWTGDIKQRILYEDKDILVCKKPAGLAVQNAKIGAMDLESMLKNYLAEKYPGNLGRNGRAYEDAAPYLAVIHRLDQPVEGILVFGKTPMVAKELNRQMAESKMEKYYLAVTGQRPVREQATLEDYLKKDGRMNTSAVVQKGVPGAKLARLSYETLEVKEHALLKVHLNTGRHHQIRVQLAHAGMPLLGDTKYGGAGGRHLALCAAQLSFLHPTKGNSMCFSIVPEGEAFGEFDCAKYQE